MSIRIRPVLSILGVFVFLTACGGAPPTLDSKPAAIPAGVDLSGQWQLRRSGELHPAPAAENDSLIIPRVRGRTPRAPSKDRSSSVHVFLEQGNALKISQTPYSLFISYDRSVVEEYTFGENRLVNVGPIEAQRVSGWESGAFVVETLDGQGTTLYETWQLESSSVLVRAIRIATDADKETYSQRQVFDRT